MVPYAQLYPGPGFKPARAIGYYLQRVVTNSLARRYVANLLGVLIGKRPRTMQRPSEAVLHELQQNGFVSIENLLSETEIAEIMSWLSEQRLTESGAYPLETVLQCPYVMRVAHDSRALSVVESYLGCRATLSSIGIRWSFPCCAPSDINTFHRDPDDWRFVKVFVYLTDVDAASGPHEYVLGSHKTRGRLFARPYTVEELKRNYGPQAIHQVVGGSGTSFIADTYGVHRGAVPSKGNRLMLLMQYSILPNYSLRYEPISAPAQAGAIDRYMMRLFVA